MGVHQVLMYVSMHLFFFPLRRNTCQSLRACTVGTSYLPDIAIALCRKAPEANATPSPPLPSILSPQDPLEDPLPLIPASCPSVLTCVPPYLLIYDLISAPRAHSRCVKGPLFALYGAIVLQKPVGSRLARLRLRSVFTSQRRSEEGEPEIHPLRISTNLPLILPADGLALVAFGLSASAHAGDLRARGPRRKSCLTAGVHPSLVRP